MRIECDYLVIGSGVAGLTFARAVADRGRVLVLSKKTAEESATRKAQGGIASVMDIEDSFEAHVQDTLTCGRGLCKKAVVEACVQDGPARIKELQAIGADFTKSVDEPETLALGREGGHSARRIVHAADATGLEVVRTLLGFVRELPNVEILEDHMAIDLIVPDQESSKRVCMGAYVLDIENDEVHTVLAPVTVLATGGAGKVYLYTSNPDISTGDGVAMAFRAGARVANMEFFQFHPTILFHPQAKGALISEAVRGEGAILRDAAGRAFMSDYDPAKELAPRDVVARAIDSEMKRSGDDCVFLDATHLGADFLHRRFPNISASCSKFGIDITSQPIPVVPAAHYTCGGIVTDVDGHTDVTGLFAIGETACTGLHGANRLASNSLLEGLVFAHRAGRIAKEVLRPDISRIADWKSGNATHSDETVVVSHDWDEIRRYMWNYVGIVRSDKRLMRARRRHDMIMAEIREYYWNYHVTADLLELRNIATMADLIIDSALTRKESRGLHYTSDYPDEVPDAAKDTIMCRYDK
ncbi:MAG: L-aspartate oxidase [Deltaproteobacteria bacterium]|nr:L-aspartate oxidase [Deltaproteobacteria bacterium]